MSGPRPASVTVGSRNLLPPLFLPAAGLPLPPPVDAPPPKSDPLFVSDIFSSSSCAGGGVAIESEDDAVAGDFAVGFESFGWAGPFTDRSGSFSFSSKPSVLAVGTGAVVGVLALGTGGGALFASPAALRASTTSFAASPFGSRTFARSRPSRHSSQACAPHRSSAARRSSMPCVTSGLGGRSRAIGGSGRRSHDHARTARPMSVATAAICAAHFAR